MASLGKGAVSLLLLLSVSFLPALWQEHCRSVSIWKWTEVHTTFTFPPPWSFSMVRICLLYGIKTVLRISGLIASTPTSLAAVVAAQQLHNVYIYAGQGTAFGHTPASNTKYERSPHGALHTLGHRQIYPVEFPPPPQALHPDLQVLPRLLREHPQRSCLHLRSLCH